MSEQNLSDAYLRIRSDLSDWGAFDTPHAPTPEQVWKTTERALNRLMMALHQTRAENAELREKIADLMKTMVEWGMVV
jgi:hypothetical protein